MPPQNEMRCFSLDAFTPIVRHYRHESYHAYHLRLGSFHFAAGPKQFAAYGVNADTPIIPRHDSKAKH